MQACPNTEKPRPRVKIEMDGYQASVPAQRFEGLNRDSERALGEIIINSQRLLALELAQHESLFAKIYKNQGETPFARVTGAILGSRHFDEATIMQIDRVFMAVGGNLPSSAETLRVMLSRYNIKAELIFQMFEALPLCISGRIPQFFSEWRLSVNALVEHFYPAALKVYWGNKRRVTGRSDEAFSDAMMLMIKCAERYNPDHGSFLSLFTTYYKYVELEATSTRQQDQMSCDPDWESVLELRSIQDDWSRVSSDDPAIIIEMESQARQLQRIIRDLSTIERIVIDNSFEIGRQSTNQRKLAADLGLSPGRLSQLKRGALSFMKRKLENETLTDPPGCHLGDC